MTVNGNLARFGLFTMAVGIALGVVSLLLGSWNLAPGGVGAVVVGAIILARRPGNGVGLALIAFGFASLLSDLNTGYMTLLPEGVPRALERAVVLSGASMFGLVGTTGCALLLVYPSGRAQGRWNWLLRALLAIGAMGVTLGLLWGSSRSNAEIARAMVSNENSSNPAELAAALTFMPGLPLSVASLIARYRSGEVIERLQIRWLMLASSLLLVTSLIQNIFGNFESLAGQITTTASFVLFPVAVGLAITRYRLFEIDRIISRTVTYGLLTSALVGVYVVGVFLLRRVLPLEGGVPVAASTLAVAALFNPLRRRVQDLVDRRFNRRRYDAVRVIEIFAHQLRGDLNLPDLRAKLQRVTAETMNPATVGLWVADRSSR